MPGISDEREPALSIRDSIRDGGRVLRKRLVNTPSSCHGLK